MKVYRFAVLCIAGLLSGLSGLAYATPPTAVNDDVGANYEGQNVLGNDIAVNQQPLEAVLVTAAVAT